MRQGIIGFILEGMGEINAFQYIVLLLSHFLIIRIIYITSITKTKTKQTIMQPTWSGVHTNIIATMELPYKGGAMLLFGIMGERLTNMIWIGILLDTLSAYAT